MTANQSSELERGRSKPKGVKSTSIVDGVVLHFKSRLEASKYFDISKGNIPTSIKNGWLVRGHKLENDDNRE